MLLTKCIFDTDSQFTTCERVSSEDAAWKKAKNITAYALSSSKKISSQVIVAACHKYDISADLDAPKSLGWRAAFSDPSYCISLTVLEELLRDFDCIDILDVVELFVESFHESNFFKNKILFLDHREVFLNWPGECLDHYSPGWDNLFDSVDEYRQATRQPAYLFGRMLLNTFFNPPIKGVTRVKDVTIPNRLGSSRHVLSDEAAFFSFSLARLPYWINIEEDRSCNVDCYLISSFGPAIFVNDVCDWWQSRSYLLYGNQEIVIILWGPQYDNHEVRQRVRDTLETLKISIDNVVHVLLLTTRPEALTLSMLANVGLPTETAGAGFCEVAGGYYLSDPAWFQPAFAQSQWERLYQIPKRTVKAKSLVKNTEYIYVTEREPGYNLAKSQAPTNALTLVQTATIEVAASQQCVEEITAQQALHANQTQTHQAQAQAQADVQRAVHIENNQVFVHYKKVIWFLEFDQLLMVHAQQMLLNKRPIYQTIHAWHMQQSFFRKLVENHVYRNLITQKIFGGPYSLYRELDALFVKKVLLPKIHAYQDGIDASWAENRYVHSLVDCVNGDHGALWRTRYYHVTQARLPKTILPLFILDREVLPEGHPTDFLLLVPYDQVEVFSEDTKRDLVDRIQRLMQIFFLSETWDEAMRLRALDDFKAFLSIVFPDFSFADWTRFFEVAHPVRVDDLKMLLILWMNGYRKGLLRFTDLLEQFDKRAFLPYFYRIFFLGARFQHELLAWIYKDHPLLALAQTLPETDNPAAWPLWERFYFHSILFIRSQFVIGEAIFNEEHGGTFFREKKELKQLKLFWEKQRLKISFYARKNPEVTQQLLERFVENLTTPEGLSVAPVAQLQIWLDGLEAILDNAIQCGTLEEQLTELSGLSLGLFDAPLAVKRTPYEIVCAEMELHLEAIDSDHGYSITRGQLIQKLEAYVVWGLSRQAALFRYLGMQLLRQPIAFYRTLYHSIPSDSPEKAYLRDRIVGFFILESVGDAYTDHVNVEALCASCFSDLDKEEVTEESIATVKLAFMSAYTALSQRPHSEKLTTLPCLMPDLINILNFPLLRQRFLEPYMGQFLRFHADILSSSWEGVGCDVAAQARWDIMRLFIRFMAHRYFSRDTTAEQARVVCNVLVDFYGQQGVTEFFHEAPDVECLIGTYARMTCDVVSPGEPWFHLLCAAKKVAPIAALAEHLLAFMPRQSTQAVVCVEAFLKVFVEHPRFFVEDYQGQVRLDEVLRAHFSGYISTPALHAILHCAEILLCLEDLPLESSLLSSLVSIAASADGLSFLETAHLSADALKVVVFLKQVVRLPIPILARVWGESSEVGLHLLKGAVEGIRPVVLAAILRYLGSLEENDRRPFLIQFTAVQYHPLFLLEMLYEFKKHGQMTAEEVIAIAGAPEALSAMEAFEARLNAERAAALVPTDDEILARTLSGVRSLLPQEVGAPEMEPARLEVLERNYRRFMHYVLDTPILVAAWQEGDIRSYAAIHMTRQQCRDTLMELREVIRRHGFGRVRRDYLIMVLAIAAVALHRGPQKQFPRPHQIVSVLNTLESREQGVVHQIPTGGGKSVIAALHAILYWAQDKTLYVVTENVQLALDHLTQFGPIYRYLGVPCGVVPISASAAFSDYVPDGVNAGMWSGYLLFTKQQELEQRSLKDNMAVVVDEVDAIAGTTVKCRMAASLHEAFADETCWKTIYQVMCQFVGEERLYQKNQCSIDTDLINFKNYLSIKTKDTKLVEFLEKIPEAFSDVKEYIKTAHHITRWLRPGVDVQVVPKANAQGVMLSYAAPIVHDTMRPDPTLSFSGAGQPLLHTYYNEKGWGVFPVEPITHTLFTLNVKHFFDELRLKGAPLVGLTATYDAVDEAALRKEQGWVSYAYPPLHPIKRLETLIFADNEERMREIIGAIVTGECRGSKNPLLIFSAYPKDNEEMAAYLREQCKIIPMVYDGYVGNGGSEAEIIAAAGRRGSVLCVTNCMSRGVDIQVEEGCELIIVMMGPDLTEANALQKWGRTSRDGKMGQVFCVVDQSKLMNVPNATPEECFEHHKKAYGLKLKANRARMQKLEDISAYVVTQYFATKCRSDAIIGRQYGYSAALISYYDFIRALYFNQQKTEWFESEYGLDMPDVESRYIQALTQMYQKNMATWLPPVQLEAIPMIEKTVPLEHLDVLQSLRVLRLGDLAFLSDIYSFGWVLLGNVRMDRLLKRVHIFEQELVRYHQDKGMSYALWSAADKICGGIGTVHGEDIALIEEGGLALIQMIQDLPFNGAGFPADEMRPMVRDYIQNTVDQINQKAWDEIALPSDIKAKVSDWLVRISQMFSVCSGPLAAVGTVGAVVAGPVPLLMDKVIWPAIKKIGLKILEKSESETAQFVVALNNIFDDLSRFADFVGGRNASSPPLLVNDALSYVLPLLKNKAIIAILTKIVEKLPRTKLFAAYVSLSPSLLTLLTPYKTQTFESLLNSGILQNLFIQFLKLDEIRVLNQESGAKIALLDQIHAKKSLDFLKYFQSLSLGEWYRFVLLTAHPEFASCVRALPEDATLGALCDWLKIPESAPLTAQRPLEILRDFQADPERRAKEAKDELQALAVRYAVTPESIATYLAQLQPSPVRTVLSMPTTKQASTLKGIIMSRQTVSYILSELVVLGCNFYFQFNSTPIIITSILLTLVLTAYFARYCWSKWQLSRVPEPKVEEAQPIQQHYARHQFFSPTERSVPSETYGLTTQPGDINCISITVPTI